MMLAVKAAPVPIDKTDIRIQRASAVPKYLTTIHMPLTGLFETFSIDFSGPLVPGPKGERYLLIYVEQLTGWPLVRVRQSDMSDVVEDFVKNEVLRHLGPPRVHVPDNARCFTAGAMPTSWPPTILGGGPSASTHEGPMGARSEWIARSSAQSPRPYSTTGAH